jgi:hypothetical protein
LKSWRYFDASNSTVMDSGPLCDFCNSINFGAAGFYASDLVDGTLFDREITLNSVLQSSEQCFFCEKIAELFRDWKRLKFDKEALDLEDACAVVSSQPVGSLEVDDEGQREGYLIRISVTVNVRTPPPSAGVFGPSMEFQKCSRVPLKVTDLCNVESLFDWENGQEEAYSGRIRPLDADTRLFRKWKESCCDFHGDHCNLIFTGKRLPKLRLIDVEDRCVVDSEDDSSYTALSYVWGKAPLPRLTKSTDEEFRKQVSLNTETLPSTIDDAIELTRSLGEKYIWVDCLCIMQDDEADKREFIPQMDSIFGFASVTIVAASGVDVWTGLPGIKPKSRTQEQIPFTIRDVSLLATLDQGGSRDETSYLGESVWFKRGWTFQEKLFAKRALIFTPEQVYWECQRASWCEDGLWETVKSPTIYRHSFDDQDFRQPWGTDVDSFERIYRKLVDEYSARTLSFPSDGLDAFAGILHHFERQADRTFLWALPVAFLSTALTWPCEPSAKRRTDLRILRSEDGTTTLCRFPSWSWVGWIGKIYYTQVFDRLDKFETADLIFYCIDGNGLPRIVQANPETQHKEGDHSPSSVWKDHSSRTIVTSEDIPESVLKLSIASDILFFWSSSAFLRVQCHEVDELGRDSPSLSFNGKVVPGFWSHIPLLDPGHGEPVEFVVIGRENAVRVENYSAPTLAVLFVSWEDGVAYRRGMVNIKISDWILVDNRVWKLISLG